MKAILFLVLTVAIATASFTVQQYNLDITVDAPDDDNIVDYAWSFGDKQTSTGKETTHSFPAAGDYDVTLTTKDKKGVISSSSQKVKVRDPPCGLWKFKPHPPKPNPGYILYDDFNDEFSMDKWFFFAAGSYVGDDGIITTGKDGLRVIPTGTNPNTGLPAFVRTIAQEDDQPQPPLPGDLDHVKWLAFMTHTSSKGYPGFDAIDGKELTFATTMSGKTFGVDQHPFGAAVRDPQADLRLAAFAFNVIDFESFMVFDFLMTNEKIYVVYERLPFGRGDALGNYASFAFQIPVGDRDVDDFVRLSISYNKAKGVVRWFINDKEVYRVNKIGYLINRKYMTLDRGGEETLVAPTQLVGGMGTFTILDGSLSVGEKFYSNRKGLVKLVSVDGYYLNPANGNPNLSFVDEDSKLESRLFGQGAELRVKKMEVFTGI